jgi:hypothetical protein
LPSNVAAIGPLCARAKLPDDTRLIAQKKYIIYSSSAIFFIQAAMINKRIIIPKSSYSISARRGIVAPCCFTYKALSSQPGQYLALPRPVKKSASPGTRHRVQGCPYFSGGRGRASAICRFGLPLQTQQLRTAALGNSGYCFPTHLLFPQFPFPSIFA